LPKTNCGDCGVPTCLAFAMKLAQKKAELAECPHASEEAQNVLGAASEPPMRLIKAGVGPDAFEIGGETEMFRHEKTFYHQTAIAVGIDDRLDPGEIAEMVSEADGYVIERVGERLFVETFYLSNGSADRGKYLAALDVVLNNSAKAVILDTSDIKTAREAVTRLDGRKPILCPRAGDTEAFVELASEAGVGLVISSDSIEHLAEKTEKAVQSGFKDILLNLGSENLSSRIQNNTIVRRAALRKDFKTFGFPQVWFLKQGEEIGNLADAVVGICKYTGLLVLPEFSKEMMLTLYTLRQNIYTDPQKPIQVDAKLYAIGDPKPDSPLFVTTNFSLTYFIVSSEIENAGISAWLTIPDCEGMSVLTAWAAGKFSGEKIGKFVKENKIEEKLTSRDIIIPGYVASISGDLEEALPGWKVTVGPQEAADLGPFIKNHIGG